MYADVTYNKATSIKTIWPRLEKDKLDNHILNDQKLVAEKNFTLENSKMAAVSEDGLPNPIDLEKLKKIFSDVNSITSRVISSKVIERLRDNPDISEWVGRGLEIHKKDKSELCDFCGQKISETRLKLLEDHFSDEYSALMGQIKVMIETLSKGMRQEIGDDSHLLYEDLRNAYQESIHLLNILTVNFNEIISGLQKQLEKKKENPFDALEGSILTLETVDNYNTALELVKSHVKKHNRITNEHKELAEAARVKIENHFVALQARQDGLVKEEENWGRLQEAIIKQEIDLKDVSDRIRFLESELRNDAIAIDDLNEHLHKFLGRNDITLETVATGGYQLIRAGIPARNLSEGEKTAISLIYFFSKIRENDIPLSSLIIVLDDPISSFDSNHLFNASSFIKKYVDGAEQLIVLTHNFWFFKQVRDWMHRKNKKKDDEYIVKTHVYSFNRGNLLNAGKSLTNFHSEYQHVFSTMLQYQKLDDVDELICYSIANTARRLLEGLTSFKTPADTGFDAVLGMGVKLGLDTAQKERISFFLNKYSHLDRIESFDNTVEVLLEEGKNVVNDILWLIKKVDLEHYNSMLKVCEAQDSLGN
ncbi:MAG: AAA family ATPase [Flavipsychrobacter sp.]|nr:AAA family ATPase [Flavipsychrobacter sp.]